MGTVQKVLLYGGTLDPESVAAYEYAKEHLQEP